MENGNDKEKHDKDMDTRNPSKDVFSLLGNELRMSILWTLWENSNEPLSFSDLRQEVGVSDSGQFNYHLNKLVGTFVSRTENGYELSMAGWSVIGAILSGVYDESASVDPIPIDARCPECGSEIEAEYKDERVTVKCTNSECGKVVSNFHYPSGALGDYERGELPFVFERWIRSQYSRVVSGFCPNCEGKMEHKIEFPEEDTKTKIGLKYRCERCHDEVKASVGTHLLNHPAVISFHYDHDINLKEVPFWDLDWLREENTEIVSDEPPRIRTEIKLDNEVLELTLNENLDIIEEKIYTLG